MILRHPNIETYQGCCVWYQTCSPSNVALCSACGPGSPVPGLRGGKRKPMPRASSGHNINANDQGAAASNKADVVTPLYSVALYALSVILLTYGFSV